MKVGIDCRLINRTQNTGISRYTEFLIEYYIKCFGSGNVVLITNDTNFEHEDCSVLVTKYKPYTIIHFLNFSKFVECIGLDLFHIPFYSGFYSKKSKIKVVVTVHDLMYRFVNEFFGNNFFVNRIKILYFDFIVKHTLLNADIIISVSETTRNDVKNTFGFDSICIPEDSNIKGDYDLSILAKYKLNYKSFYFYCGNNRPHKNIDFIKNIFKNNPNLPPLVLAGKGHESCNNVIVTGIISENELKALYKSTIAFIFPSKYEGFGLPVIESLRENTFVVASKISAFLEFKSVNIFFFELGNRIEFLEAIQKSKTLDFQIDSFLNHYDKNHIYQLNDKMLSCLLKNIKSIGN